MKILTGSLKGRAIVYTPHLELRPTGDKVRKAIIDILQQVIGGQRVLDLYSGTGALGLEALSAGASFVCFVEKNAGRSRQIELNLKRFDRSGQAEVVNKDAFSAMTRLSHQNEIFDLLFMDPPYAEGLCLDTIREAEKLGLVMPGGFVVAECRKRDDLPEELGSLRQVMTRKYGQTKLVIYQKR